MGTSHKAQAIAINDESWSASAKAHQCVMEALASHLPEINKLLDTSFSDISTRFMQLAEDVKSYHDKANNAALDEDYKKLSQAIMGITVGMQFQDRVSQNLVITINVLNMILDQMQHLIAASDTPISTDTAKQLLSLLNMGETRQKYIDQLMAHGYILDPLDIGYHKETVAAASSDDDIDLF